MMTPEEFSDQRAEKQRELDRLEGQLAARSLRRFVELFWDVVEPQIPFVPNWHLDLICEELESITRGENDRLIINIPPGCMKSLLVSVMWPAWEWATNSYRRYITVSYSDSLSMRDNLRVRNIVRSARYQRLYELGLDEDQNAKGRFNTDNAGYRMASSIRGPATGEHPDRGIIDDPLTARQARSKVERDAVWDWIGQTFSTRGMSRGAAIVLVMQRLHEEDPAGRLMKQGGWRLLRLPMMYEPENAHPRDPRKRKGELLWPALFPVDKVKKLMIALGEYGVAGQLQQRPSPEGGGLFKREWFRRIAAIPVPVRARVRGWDTAATEGDGDFTVGTRMAYGQDGVVYVEHVARGQWSPSQVDRAMINCARVDGPETAIREEQEGGSAGKTVCNDRARKLIGFDYAGVQLTGDKATRAGPFRSQAEVGNIVLVEGPWIEEWLDELENFPNGSHDDQVDSSSCTFNELVKTEGFALAVSPHSIRNPEANTLGFGYEGHDIGRPESDDDLAPEERMSSAGAGRRKHRYGY